MTVRRMLERPDYEAILARIQQMQASADSKTGVLTAIQVGVLAYVLPAVAGWLEKPTTSALIQIGLAFGAGLMALGIGLAMFALFPRTKNPHSIRSVTFFGDIDTLSSDDYSQKLEKMDEPEWKAEYINQIHVNAV